MGEKSRIDELREDIDALKRFLRLLWSKRIVYVKYSLVAALLAIVVALSIPKIYSSTTILALEPRRTGYNAAVMGLAGMAGINLGFLSEDAYSAELYPTIIYSKDFVADIAAEPVALPEGDATVSYARYLAITPKNVWWSKVAHKVKKIIGGDKVQSLSDADVPVGLVGKIRGNIRCQVNKTLGLVTITAYDAGPVVAKTMAEKVSEKLNLFIQEYRTSKTRADYDALMLICDSAKIRYLDAQNKYQSFVECGTSGNSHLYKAQCDFLEGEAQLAYAAYNQMASQAQLAQVKLQEATPVYNVIQSAYIPQNPETPGMLPMILLFITVACLIATIKIICVRVREKLWGA